MTEPTVAAWVVRALAMAVGAFGGDSAVLLREIGVSPEVFDDVEARLPHRVVFAAWEAAPRLARDPSFALHLAETWSVGAFDVLEYCMRASRTLRDSLDQLVRYQRLLHDASNITVEEEGDEVRIRRRLFGALEPAPGSVAEFLFASLVIGGRRTTGVDWSPRQVRFAHPRPDSTADHARIFRAPFSFDAGADMLVLHRPTLDLPMCAGDPTLGAVLERQARALLDRLPSVERLADQVRRHACLHMRGRVPPVSEVARALGIGERTLHRRLASEGTTCGEIVDDVRRELALAHVRTGVMPLGEIAFVLGFSESSAFHRAFRRWTGKTPREWRQGK